MFFLRMIGIWFLLATVIALVVDGTKSLAANELVVTSLGDNWLLLHEASLKLAKEAVEKHLHPLVWDPAITALLFWPSWALLGLIGLILVWLGRKRHSANIYSN